MARAPVPTVEYFRAKAVKPASFESIPDDDLADMLVNATDHVASALAKHSSGIITEWDGSLVRSVLIVAAYDAMSHRGFKKDAGADAVIVTRASENEAWLSLVASGEREPWFVDGTDEADNAPEGGHSAKSDAWVK